MASRAEDVQDYVEFQSDSEAANGVRQRPGGGGGLVRFSVGFYLDFAYKMISFNQNKQTTPFFP